MVRTITDNPGGWSRSLPGHTIEFDASFAQPFYNGATVGVNAGATGTYAITISDAEHIFFPDMISITPQAYKEFAVIIYVNGSPYVAASGIGWLNIPLRQNPSIQLISADVLRIDVINLDGSARNFLVKVNGTKIIRPVNFGHAPGAVYTKTVAAKFLKCYDNVHYAGQDGSWGLIADATAPLAWQAFFFGVGVGGRVSILMEDCSHKLQATTGGGSTCVVTTNPVGIWESFTLVDRGDGYFSFKCYDGSHWLSAANGGGSTVNAAAPNMLTYERFLVGTCNVDLNVVVAGSTFTFTDASTFLPTSWDWDFGDGSPHSALQNPTHVYSVPGTYYPRLKTTNQYGYDTYAESTGITVI